ncbi:MAG: ArsR family transcriptional regulator [Actinomycetota bacterium]
MRTEAPLLLPLFRSEGQGKLLARVYLAADRPAPIRALANELGIDAGGLTREADRLESAGLVRSERIGRQRLLRPNTDSPYYPELHGLLLKAFGPATMIGPPLAAVSGIERAYLFGSWAARYLGQPGGDPADVDLLIVGSPPRRDVARVTRTLSQALGREVNATIVTAERWRGAGDGFIRQVRSGPLVEVDLGEAGGEGR